MLTYNSKILTIGAFGLVIYLMINSLQIKGNTYKRSDIVLPNTEERIKQIREEASGKEKIAKEKEISLQEKVAYSVIDYIMGEEFRKKFIKND